jgi:hypothetical protein
MAEIINFEDYTEEELEALPEAAQSAQSAPVRNIKATFDFDNFWSEKAQDVFEITVYGATHQIPASIPAEVVLGVMRMHQAGMSNVPDEKVISMTEAIFGIDTLDSWCKRGLTVERMGDLLTWALEQYQSQRPLDGKKPQAKVKRGKQRQP